MAKIGSEAIKILSNSTKTQAGNLSSLHAVGAKRFENVVVESRAGSVHSGSSFITSTTRSTLNIQGKITSTGVNSDIALEGDKGMFVVASGPNENRVFTRRGDFRQDELGFWKNGASQLLMAWELDDAGNVPQNASLLSSLKAVNFANTKGDPKATTSISIAMNLNSNNKELVGAGPRFGFSRSVLNSSTAKVNTKDIIFPEVTINGALRIGDRFTFTSPPAQSKILEFGGIAAGRAPNANAKIAGISNINQEFKTNVADPTTGLLANSGIKITVGGADGQEINFSFKQGGVIPSKREYNSIKTLEQAINSVSALSARIDSNGILHIASTDPNLQVDFEDTNGSTLVAQLGLTNIPTAAAGIKRFNSLYNLNLAVNDQQDTYSLKASIENGAIKISSLLATEDLTLTADSTAGQKISRAVIGGTTQKTRATVAITAPNNGLRAGDYVRLSGGNLGTGQVPSGLYYVGAADSNGFTINLLSNDASAPAGNAIADGVPALNNVVTHTDPAGVVSWKKVPGRAGPTANATIAVVNAPAHTCGIDVADVDLGGAAAAANDLFYISGAGTYNFGGNNTIQLPDGYYRITAAAAPGAPGITRYTIQAANVAAAAPPAGSPNTMSVTRIGNVAAGGFNNGANAPQTFNASVLETVNAGDNLRMHLPNSNYSVGDHISFKGLPANYTMNAEFATPILNDKKYRISARTDQYVEIEITDPAGVIQDATAGGVSALYKTIAGAAATDLNEAFEINYFSRSLEFLFEDDKTQNTQSLVETYEKTYDVNNVDKRLSNSDNNNFGTDVKFTQTLKGFDSLGTEYNLLIHFAKLQKDKWAVEIAAISDKNGIFDVQDLPLDGFIKGGILDFDTNGNFLNAQGLSEPLTFARNNGSQPISLTIDWQNELGTIKNGKVSQYASSNNFEFTQQDGRAAGTLVDIKVQDNGKIVGTYNSGETRELYQIPIATFPNVNGLVPGFGGTYNISQEAGDLLLKSAGAGGVAKTVGSALEETNADSTEELMKVKDISFAIQANARVVGVRSQDQKTILAETQ